ncbi:hypothetical protein C8F01DRAFT_1145022 [Mycena amicta]|nr:hypothetical protein C8F01DRAFT_1145022 [Mycena amicta]
MQAASGTVSAPSPPSTSVNLSQNPALRKSLRHALEAWLRQRLANLLSGLLSPQSSNTTSALPLSFPFHRPDQPAPVQLTIPTTSGQSVSYAGTLERSLESDASVWVVRFYDRILATFIAPRALTVADPNSGINLSAVLPTPRISLSANLILSALRRSVAAGRPVHLATQVVHHNPDVGLNDSDVQPVSSAAAGDPFEEFWLRVPGLPDPDRLVVFERFIVRRQIPILPQNEQRVSTDEVI